MPFRLGISSLSDISCKRKRSCYVLSRKKGIDIDEFDNSERFNTFGQLGKIIHLIIQLTLKTYSNYIEYLYYRKKFPLEQAIEKAAEKIFNYFSFLLEKRLELEDISETNYIDILNEFRNQNKCFSSKLNKFLILNDKNQKIETKIIDNEFDVSYEILPGILITGKIDLVSFDKQEIKLEIVEIKTGKTTRIADHRRQLKLYKEIFEKNQDVNLNIWLWNTKLGAKENHYNTISPVKTTKRSELDKIKEFIRATLKIKNQNDLDPELNKHFAGEKCEYCLYCKNLNKILPPTYQASIISFSKSNTEKKDIKIQNYETNNEKDYRLPENNKFVNIKLLKDFL